jgi:hypothetical protein
MRSFLGSTDLSSAIEDSGLSKKLHWFAIEKKYQLEDHMLSKYFMHCFSIQQTSAARATRVCDLQQAPPEEETEVKAEESLENESSSDLLDSLVAPLERQSVCDLQQAPPEEETEVKAEESLENESSSDLLDFLVATLEQQGEIQESVMLKKRIEKDRLSIHINLVT